MTDPSMTDPSIRPATACDVALLSALQAACFQPDGAAESAPGSSETGHVGEAWSLRSWAEVLAMPGSFALLAVRAGPTHDPGPHNAGPHNAEDEPVGFFLAQVLFTDGELLSFGVAPAYRRCGYGRRLLAEGLAIAQRQGAERVQLEVAENNRRAQNFYISAGFSLIGRRPGYYRLGDGKALDALILRKSLA